MEGGVMGCGNGFGMALCTLSVNMGLEWEG